MSVLPTRDNYKEGLIPRLGRSWGLTKNIPFPNLYVKMLPEYKNWIFLEEEAISLKGHWRDIFPEPGNPLDLEIGCGNGFFFAQQAARFPNRNLLGVELKYKPLVQTVRRVKTKDQKNGRGIRFHAGYIDGIFHHEEIDNIFLYFPDPWPKKRQRKNRLIHLDFLDKLFAIQKVDRYIDFKTDSEDYFDCVAEEVKKSKYKVTRLSRNLHSSEWANENFQTSFEKIFASKGQPIFYMRLLKGHQ